MKTGTLLKHLRSIVRKTKQSDVTTASEDAALTQIVGYLRRLESGRMVWVTWLYADNGRGFDAIAELSQEEKTRVCSFLDAAAGRGDIFEQGSWGYSEPEPSDFSELVQEMTDALSLNASNAEDQKLIAILQSEVQP